MQGIMDYICQRVRNDGCCDAGEMKRSFYKLPALPF